MAIFLALEAGALVSLGLGLFGLVRRLSWALSIGAACGLVFSYATGFSIGFWVLLWPAILLGQLVTMRSRPVFRWIALGVSALAWAAFLTSRGVALVP